MELFAKLFSSLPVFGYHCFDRVVIHGYLSGVSRPDQVVYFFREVLGIPVVSKEALSQRTNEYRNWVEAYVGNHHIPIEWPEKGLRKEDHVLPALRRMEKNNAFGVYFVFQEHGTGPHLPHLSPEVPVLHGMADDRVNVLVNAMPLAAACPNHMNPAMSYIDPANVAGITVMAGITPVSSVGDSIGGTIAVESAAPEFAKQDQGVQVHGGFSTAYRTNEAVDGDSAWVSVATANFSVGYVGSYAHAADYKDGAGAMVLSNPIIGQAAGGIKISNIFG
jgi:TonB-dependent Receptor Plug Domain